MPKLVAVAAPALAVALALCALTGCAEPQSVTAQKAPTASPARGADESADPGTGDPGPGGAEVADIGQWAKAEDGVAFRVSKLTRGRVGPYAAGAKPGSPAVIVTVQFRNGGKTRFDTSLVEVQARLGADGDEAEQVFDEHYGEGFTGTLVPGRTATALFMFAAAKSADLRKVSVEISPGLEYDSFTFEGAVKA